MTVKELSLRGSFRFHHEFPKAVAFMRSKRVDVSPLITQALPYQDAEAAFELAGDRTQSVKVQLDFAG